MASASDTREIAKKMWGVTLYGTWTENGTGKATAMMETAACAKKKVG